jgi:putative transposase
VKDEFAPKKRKNKIVNKTIGIDLNIATIVTSENTIYKQATKTKKYKKLNNKKKRLQRALSRKYLVSNKDNKKNIKYSQNYKKNKSIINKLERRLTNIRDDCHKKIIDDIFISPPSKIVIEDLHVKEMTDKKKRKKMTYQEKLAAKNIHTASFKKFSRLLIEKSNKYNITIIKADKYYASTKKCSCCGNKKIMKIDDRIYKCDICNLIIDRDLNAAINLANYIN